MMRCHVCSELQYEDSEPGTESCSILFNTSYHENIRGVRQSVDQGCEFCTMVIAVLNQFGNESSEPLLDNTKIKLKLWMETSWSREGDRYTIPGGAVFLVQRSDRPQARDIFFLHVKLKVDGTYETSPPVIKH